MTLKEARALATHLKGWENIDFLPPSNCATIILDNRIIKLEKQLAKCQENKDRAHMGAAEKLSEISAYKECVKELEKENETLLQQASDREMWKNDALETKAQLKEIMNWYDKDNESLGDTSEIFEKARQLLEE